MKPKTSFLGLELQKMFNELGNADSPAVEKAADHDVDTKPSLLVHNRSEQSLLSGHHQEKSEP